MGPSPATLSIAALSPGPFQPRATFDPVALAGLAASIRAQGVLQPLLVRPCADRPGHYHIIAGERRWRAAQAAGLHAVPVYIRDLTDAEARAAALVENLQRDDLTPIEEAEAYQRLMSDCDLSHDAIGTLVGKSRSHVANTLRLLNLTPATRWMVQSGQLTAGHARALLGRADADALAMLVIRRGLNVRQAEALARQPAPTAPVRDTDIVALENELSGTLGLVVHIAAQDGRGTVQLTFATLDQLDDVLRRLRGP